MKQDKRISNVSNSYFAKTIQTFKDSCDLAGLKPSPRQASKFRNHKGRAYAAYMSAKEYKKFYGKELGK
jgi:hypothetical protein